MKSYHYMYSIIVPLLNERAVIESLIERLERVKTSMADSVEIILVDDGSTDGTREWIMNYARHNTDVTAVVLARNFGHQLAVSAGMQYSQGTKGIMIIDGDLQDPPELMKEMAKFIDGGYDVVYAIRRNRKEKWYKKTAYSVYYRIQSSISDIAIPLDAGDFSMLSRRVVDIMNKMPEESRYLRGLRAWIGMKQIGIEYDRSERTEGESKYTLRRLFKLAYDGVYNFSTLPIRIIRWTGAISFSASIIYFVSVLIKRLLYDAVPEGFTALLAAIILFSGIQLFSISVIGEYMVRIFFQVKGRPLYIVDSVVRSEEELVSQDA